MKTEMVSRSESSTQAGCLQPAPLSKLCDLRLDLSVRWNGFGMCRPLPRRGLPAFGQIIVDVQAFPV